MKSPRFAFFGTPHFSRNILSILESAGLTPSLIVTAPDKPRGRGQLLSPTPVKEWADERGIPVLTPDSIQGNEHFKESFLAHNIEIAVVVAYGFILPLDTLSLAPKGFINVHPSLLPKHRGAAPIESQILSDDKEFGTTIMLMDHKMDHGPILAQKRAKMPSPVPDAFELEKHLTTMSGELLGETLIGYVAGDIHPQGQLHTEATYTSKISKKDTLINLNGDPRENFLKIQAFKRFKPHFFIEKDGKTQRIVVTKASFNKKTNALVIERVIPEGGKEINYEDL